MKKLIFLIVFAFNSIFILKSDAKIVKINQISQIEAEVTSESLVVFDIDNTLLAPEYYLGSDEWYGLLFKLYFSEGVEKIVAEGKASATWNQTQSIIQLRPVEEIAPALITKLQSIGAKTIAISARDPQIAEVTLSQLSSNGISFKDHSISKEKFSNQQIHYQDGVAFLGWYSSKGTGLSILLEQFKFSPQKIVFVDDKERHVKSVDQFLNQLEIPHVCYLYGALEEKAKSFSEFVSFKMEKKEITDQIQNSWSEKKREHYHFYKTEENNHETSALFSSGQFPTIP